MIWTLILHYQISLGLGLDENSKDNKKTTAKQALLGYIRVRLLLRYSYSEKLAELSIDKERNKSIYKIHFNNVMYLQDKIGISGGLNPFFVKKTYLVIYRYSLFNGYIILQFTE